MSWLTAAPSKFNLNIAHLNIRSYGKSQSHFWTYMENVTHLIEMSRMSGNYIFGKTGKCDQQSFFFHFYILLEMGAEICL